VDTIKIKNFAVSETVTANTGASINLKGNGGHTTVQTLALNVLAGERVDIIAIVSIWYHPNSADEDNEGNQFKHVSLNLYRDDALIKNARVMTLLEERDMSCNAIITYSGSPGAGNYIYTLEVDHGTDDNGINTCEATDRYIRATREKK